MNPSTRTIATAIVLIGLGVIAFIEPLVAGLAVTALVGWLLIAAAFTHGFSAFYTRTIGQILWQLILAFVYFSVGAYFLMRPLIGLSTLTLLLAAVLCAEALLNLVAYFSLEGEPGSGWFVVNAFITMLLAAFIWRQWPSATVWAIGSIVGINLVMNGFGRLMLGETERMFEREAV
jgi:uncharacterized membrane protein HdeD (DUF308 family)